MKFILGVLIGAALGSPAIRTWIGVWAKEFYSWASQAVRNRMGSK